MRFLERGEYQKKRVKGSANLLNFNRLELMTGKIKVSSPRIRDAVREEAIPVSFDPNVNIDALAAASRIKK